MKASFVPIRWCEQPLSSRTTVRLACMAAATARKFSPAYGAGETVGSTTPTSEHDASPSPRPLPLEEKSASFAKVNDLVDCFSLRGFISQRGRRPADLSWPPLVSSSLESLWSGHSKERCSGLPHSQHSRHRPPPPRPPSLADFSLLESLAGLPPPLPPLTGLPRCLGWPPCFIRAT
ncbi:unnamed protein product [Closterium sp. NIES-54]